MGMSSAKNDGSGSRQDRSAGPLSFLIICSAFPPANLTGARRPYYLARQLLARGHRVSILTEHFPDRTDWNADTTGMKVLRLEARRVTKDMNWIQRSLAGWSLNSKETRHGRLFRLMADLFLPLTPGHRWELDDARLEPHDVVIATGPHWSTFEYGDRYRRMWNSSFFIDYRDPWSIAIPEVGLRITTWQGDGIAGWSRRRRMRRLEERYASNAIGVTAATPGFLQNALEIIGDRPSLTVFNGHGSSDTGISYPANERFTIAYTGSIYEEQEWHLVHQALLELQDRHPDAAAKIHVRLIGAVTLPGPVMRLVNEMSDTLPFVERVGRKDREETMALQKSADMLLHVGFKNKRDILPLKFIEYIHSGRPILQVGTDHDLQEEILLRTRTGYKAATPEEILNIILEQLRCREEGRPAQLVPDAKALQEFSWSWQMERWCEFMERSHLQRTGMSTLNNTASGTHSRGMDNDDRA
jgi:glycosyltransferase involved in cell wall biosynthesis